jgi:hypothetical protein
MKIELYLKGFLAALLQQQLTISKINALTFITQKT